MESLLTATTEKRTQGEGLDADYVKANVLPMLENRGWNKETLAGKPHRVVLGGELAVTYFCPQTPERPFFNITDWELEDAGLSEEDLFSAAIENSKPNFEIRTMNDLLVALAPEGVQVEVPEVPPLYVGTSRDKRYGAAVLLFPEQFRVLGEKFGDLYVLPSSVHEVLLTPVNGSMTKAELDGMVYEINRQEVVPWERLADHVFLYRHKTCTVELADE